MSLDVDELFVWYLLAFAGDMSSHRSCRDGKQYSGYAARFCDDNIVPGIMPALYYWISVRPRSLGCMMHGKDEPNDKESDYNVYIYVILQMLVLVRVCPCLRMLLALFYAVIWYSNE